MKSALNTISTARVQNRPGSSLRGVLTQTVLRAREGQLSVTRQLLEMAALRLFYGLGPGFYHTARFWRKGLPWAFKTGFWPYGKFRGVLNKINPPSYQKMSQDKVCEKAILQLVGIPTPQFFGSLHHKRGLSASGNRLTNADELHQLLLCNPGVGRLCFKLVEGSGGQGFQVVEIIRKDAVRLHVLESGNVMSVSDFLTSVLALDQGAGYIVEDYVKQHPDLGKLNASSVNTIRVWASCVDGETAVIDAFLRVGGSGSLVDNTSRGAHIFRLDLDSGTIGDGMIKNIYNDTFQCHRDTGERISGGTLPYWNEVLSLAQQAVAAFPHINFAGVDIAIAEGGPVVIELNVEPDPTSAIIFDRSHRELLQAFVNAFK